MRSIETTTTSLGADYDGITDISLRHLEQFSNKKLVSVRITHGDIDTKCAFIFEDMTSYVASGFAIGYGGEGPHGLWKAIRMWHPNKISADFWETEIPKLLINKNYTWTADHGFEETV